MVSLRDSWGTDSSFPVPPERVVLIRPASGRGHCSGYVLKPDLVMTTAHSLVKWGQPTSVQMRQEGHAGWHDAKVEPSRGGDRVALLRPAKPLGLVTPEPSVGVYVGRAPLPCNVYGYPQALIEDQQASLWESEGEVAPRGGRGKGYASVSVRRPPNSVEHLQGCSGGPVTVKGSIFGLVDKAAEAWDGGLIQAALTSTRLSRMRGLRYVVLDAAHVDLSHLSMEEVEKVMTEIREIAPELAVYVPQVWSRDSESSV